MNFDRRVEIGKVQLVIGSMNLIYSTFFSVLISENSKRTLGFVDWRNDWVKCRSCFDLDSINSTWNSSRSRSKSFRIQNQRNFFCLSSSPILTNIKRSLFHCSIDASTFSQWQKESFTRRWTQSTLLPVRCLCWWWSNYLCRWSVQSPCCWMEVRGDEWTSGGRWKWTRKSEWSVELSSERDCRQTNRFSHHLRSRQSTRSAMASSRWNKWRNDYLQCHSYGLTVDDEGFLYMCDWEKHEVRRWRIGDIQGTLVAGGNGQGQCLDQLFDPSFIFVDRDHSLYMSDEGNERVMKWEKDAKLGVVVAGGQGQGNALTQLSNPRGLVVDQLGTIYVADCSNQQIMCWRKGATQGSIVIGGNCQGGQAKQLNYPVGLSFDFDGNFYVVDRGNHRVQKLSTIVQ